MLRKARQLGTLICIMLACTSPATAELAGPGGYTGLFVIADDGRTLGVDAQTGDVQQLGQISGVSWDYLHASTYDPILDKIYVAWTDGGMVGEMYTIDAESLAIDRMVNLSWARAYEFAYDTTRDRVLVCGIKGGMR